MSTRSRFLLYARVKPMLKGPKKQEELLKAREQYKVSVVPMVNGCGTSWYGRGTDLAPLRTTWNHLIPT